MRTKGGKDVVVGGGELRGAKAARGGRAGVSMAMAVAVAVTVARAGASARRNEGRHGRAFGGRRINTRRPSDSNIHIHGPQFDYR
jgi:hypothetical protein